ncbi:hypothetical protein GCM10010211_14050 [Streptomyces albospinus]|uniref:Uncharacterized protein n=2 Tax=Streptomyces albospinus TaxID=285515 RepID=A0ABQ2UUH7_9ACTN|nr:hypothetical protein GCM10010211_14050 [Streptomyces albospinus]
MRHPRQARRAAAGRRSAADVHAGWPAGTVRRCHFARAEPGNPYDGGFRGALRPRPCPLAACDCPIGCVHVETLPLYDVFAGGVPERIPAAGRFPAAGIPAGAPAPDGSVQSLRPTTP